MSDTTPTNDSTYTFLPWARSGLSNLVTGTPPSSGRASLSVSLYLNNSSSPGVQKTLALLGPGEVRGLHPGAILRTVPTPDEQDFPPDYFPCVEFADPDLPWQFTPTGESSGRLTPWLVLIVVPEAQVSLETRPDACPVLSIPGAQVLSPDAATVAPAKVDPAVVQLPPLSHAWALAHAQVLGPCENGDLEAIERTAPERTVSRLLYPFPLPAHTRLLACVVPSFAIGVIGGLGYSPYSSSRDGSKLAWENGVIPSVLPVYHHWRFKTGEAGTFADLVLKLKRIAIPQASGVGCHGLDLSTLVPGVEDFAGIPALAQPGRHGPLEGVLRAPGMRSLAYQWDGVSRQRFEDALLSWMSCQPGDAPLEVTTETATTRPAPGGTTDSSVTSSGPAAQGSTQGQPSPSSQAREVRILAGLRHERMIEQESQQDDPVVTPPLYGGWQAGIASSSPEAWEKADREWLGPLNLEPGLRATAGLGVRTVQKHQEALMASAWEQLETLHGDIQGWKRSRLQRNTKAFSRRVQRRHHERRLKKLGGPALLQLTGRVHARLPSLGAGNDFREDVRKLGFAPAVFQPRFRRATRPGGSLLRCVLGTCVDGSQNPSSTHWLTGFNGTFSLVCEPNGLEQAADASRDPITLLNADVVKVMRSLLPTGEPQNLLDSFATLQAMLSRWTEARNITLPVELSPEGKAHLLTCLNPSTTLAETPPEPMPYPEFPIPVYALVAEEAPYLLLPGAEYVTPDTLTVVESNGRFVEAYLAGMNHELARELLWRGFPTDQRGSYFRRFWETFSPDGAPAPDVAPLDRWHERLGDNAAGGGSCNRLVLLVRGELVRRFPNAIISAVEAAWDTNGEKRVLGAAERLPLFCGTLPPDITFFGFDLEYLEALGSTDPEKHPGWWFVLQEQPTELRFGNGENWCSSAKSTNGTSAAAAKAAMEGPIRVAIHADDLLPLPS